MKKILISTIGILAIVTAQEVKSQENIPGTDICQTEEQNDMMKKVRIEIARLREQNYSCSQATLLGICKALGSSLTEQQIMALSAGFRGGIGRSYNEGTCGALSVGVMALGMYLPDKNEKTIALSKELFDHFKQANGTVICGNIVQRHGFSRCTGCCLCIGNKVAELLQREKALADTAQVFPVLYLEPHNNQK